MTSPSLPTGEASAFNHREKVHRVATESLPGCVLAVGALMFNLEPVPELERAGVLA